MKKLIYILIGIIISGASVAYAQSPFIIKPVQGGTGIGSVTAGDINKCFVVTNNSPFTIGVGTCGSGGGGSGGGTFSTSTNAAYGGVYNNYPNNATDIVEIGSTSGTSSAPYWFDPNSKRAFLQHASTTYITAVMASTSQAIFSGGPWVDARSCGAKGDGVTDDSTAINNCITNLNTAGGGKLYISAAPNRSATTKYNICAASINMKPYIDVEVQRGVEIQVCNGFATSTVVFPSNTAGTYFAHWKGGTFSEAGVGKKLWTAFNVESTNINGGVFWNTISDAIINLPSVCVRLSVIGGANGWLNSNTLRDIVCNDPTNAFTFNDDRTGSFVIDETLFDNIQIQSNSSTETCFGDLKAWNTQLINNFCYDMNATSTSLSINGASLSTLIEGGYLTAYNFVDNGARTVMVGDRLWPFYATSTAGSMYMYANGSVLFGTTSTNYVNENMSLIEGNFALGGGTVSRNSKIIFYRGGGNDNQQDYMKAATTSGQSPNSGDIGISARQDVVINIDSDSTASGTFFAIRNNRSDIGITTTNELFRVDEVGRATQLYSSTTNALSAATICLTADTCRTTWPSSSVAGADTQVQFNDGDAFAGNANLIFNKTTGITTAAYASSTALSVSTGAFFSTGTSAGAFQPVMVGSTTPPLFTVGSLAPFSAFRKENTVTNTFYPVIQGIEVNNASSVISGGGPCFSLAEHSNITGRELRRDCTMYDNTLLSIGSAAINFVVDTNGVFQPYQRTNRIGNMVIGATTTDAGNPLSRLTLLSPVNSTQDQLICQKGIGTGTTTNCVLTHLGWFGSGTTTPGTALGIVGDEYITGRSTASVYVSTSTITSNIFPYASTTALSATTLCLTGDTCRTTWPTGGGGGSHWATTSPTQGVASTAIAPTNAANVGVGTSTPWWNHLFSVATTTGTHINLIGNITDSIWSMRSIGNHFYLATSSPTTGATTTTAALDIDGTSGAKPYFDFATSSPGTAILNLGPNPSTTNGSTTIRVQKLQIESLEGGGHCTFINFAGSLVTIPTLCNN